MMKRLTRPSFRAPRPPGDPTLLVFTWLCAFHRVNGNIPTIREIARAMHMSHTAVVRHLDKLEAWGYIAREFGKPRAIQILRDCE